MESSVHQCLPGPADWGPGSGNSADDEAARKDQGGPWRFMDRGGVQDADVYRHTASSYSQSLLRNMLSHWEEGQFCDVKVLVEGEAIPAHRLVLAGASPYFRAMFTLGLKEQDQEEVELHGIRASVFRGALRFMYSGVVDVTADNCQDLLTLASMMGLSEIVRACSVFLSKHMTPDNCIGIFHFAELHSIEGLRELAETYICSHFTELPFMEEFLEMEKEALITLLQSEHLLVESESQVLEAALTWLSHHLIDRRKCFYEVMSAVRVPIIPRKQLEAITQSCTDLSLRVALTKLQQKFHVNSRRQMYDMQPRLSARKHIYVIGGYSRTRGARWNDTRSLMTMECLDLFKEQWAIMPSMSEMRNGHGAAVLDGMIFVAGGECESLIFDSVERYNPVLNDWCCLQPMILPRYGLGLVAFQGCLLAVGGWVGSEIGKSMERYLPNSDAWIPEGPMAHPRFSAGLVEHEGLVYVAGGLVDTSTDTAVVDAYNPITREWETLAPLSSPRSCIGLAAVDGFLYAVGGWSLDESNSLDNVERYSIEKNQWMTLPPLKSGRAGPAVVVVNRMLYVIGGRTRCADEPTQITLDSVECLDLKSLTWQDAPQVPTSRCESVAVVM